MRWSVVLEAEGDRVVTHDEVVGLADAVAGVNGIASGIGTTTYAARIEVDADTPEQAREQATAAFVRAASTAGLPAWPVTTVGLANEDEDDLGYAE
jgi:hypothetical protein